MELISIYNEEAKRLEYIASVNDTTEAEIIEAFFTALDDNGIRDYGYTRECDAKRSYNYKYPENTEFWTSAVEIVQIEG